MSAKTTSSCPSCDYPLSVEYVGQTAVCAYCGEDIEVIAQDEGGVTLPTPLFVGLLAFGFGMLLGPAIIASTEGGQKWLEKQARSVGG